MASSNDQNQQQQLSSSQNNGVESLQQCLQQIAASAQSNTEQFESQKKLIQYFNVYIITEFFYEQFCSK